MSTRSPQLDVALATEHLALIDPTGKRRLGWALKDEHTGQWLEQKPTTAARIIAKVSQLTDPTHTSVFICHAPRKPGATARTAGEAHRPRLVWTDYDAQLDDKGGFPDHLITQGGPLEPYVNVALSGSKGNRHITVEVDTDDAPLSCDSVRLLNYLLCAVLHGDWSQWHDASVLRLWGTFNYRPSKGLHNPVQVQVAQRASQAIKPRDLLKLLMAQLGSTNLAYYKQESKVKDVLTLSVKHIDQASLLKRIKPGLRAPIRLNDLSFFPGNDDSAKLFNLYRDVLQYSDFDAEDLLTLMMSFEPFVDRMSHRPDAEISNAYQEFLDSEERQEVRKQFLMNRAGKTEPKQATEEADSTPGKAEVVLMGPEAAQAATFAEHMVDAIPNLYRSGDGWCLVRPGEDGDPIIYPVDPAVMVSQAHRYMELKGPKKKRGGGVVEDDDGEPVIMDVSLDPYVASLALKDIEVEGKYLAGLSALPCLIRPDGTLASQAGYDHTTKLFFTQAKPLDIPERPSAHDIAEAKRLIFGQILADVQWASKGDLANYFSMLMTPVLRHYIGLDAHVPAAGIDANGPGAGKGLLFDIIANVSPANNIQFVNKTQEIDKNIPIALGSSAAVVRVDNVSEPIKHDRYCELFTSSVWTTRKFGSNTVQLKLRNDKLWVFTGNNLRFEGDMRRRVVMSRIHADPNPENRRDFVMPDLVNWINVPENQIAVYRALVILALGWINAGAKTIERPNATFTTWTSTMAGLCEHYRLQGFMENIKEMKQADTETNEMVNFLDWWFEEFGNRPTTVRDLINESGAALNDRGSIVMEKGHIMWDNREAAWAWQDNEFEVILRHPKSPGQALTYKLEKHLDGTFGPYRLKKATAKVQKRVAYIVTKY